MQKLLKQGKSFTVRLKVPEGETEFTDLVYGTIKVQNKDLDDLSLQDQMDRQHIILW